jgi:glycosyltransferase involved in cell wall biosynthesis
MIRRGHEVRLLCPQESRIHSEAVQWKVPAIGLPIARKRPLGVKCLFEWLKRYRCDVVSTHSSTDAWLAALALMALGRPYPMVRTRHISAPVPRNRLSRWLYTRATSRIVATLRSWKGHRYLVEALASLPPGVDLVIVGDGPQREALETLVDKLKLRERVRFAGDQRDVLPWLQALDVFVLPSYANEGVPQALVQAMLVGLPCVTTHAGSIAELAAHEKTALVVPPQDASALRLSIEKLLNDENLGKRLGAAARTHCSASYSYDRMRDRMEAIYRQVSGRY